MNYRALISKPRPDQPPLCIMLPFGIVYLSAIYLGMRLAVWLMNL